MDWTDLHHSDVGKMFGVLVVRTSANELAFLAAFSGKIGERSTILPFVPPFYDRHDPAGFFRIGEEELNSLNRAIEELTCDPDFLSLQKRRAELQTTAEETIANLKDENRAAKMIRQKQRADASELDEDQRRVVEEGLKKESIHRHFLLKDLKRNWRERIAAAETQLQPWTERLAKLQQKRKQKSASLQQRLFDQYQFLNTQGEKKGVTEIFTETTFRVPPAGAGDCAAPKLLQFAFQHNLAPIAMAEFWWGPAPKSAIRKHGHFYPACRGKCEPILGHMLLGLEVAENPLIRDRIQVDYLEVIYEDEYLLAINKPPGFLAVPGKSWTDSVYTRMRQAYPEATGPLIVHRLDMSTSGLMVIAKTKAVHKELQHQFAKRTVHKRYVAILDGTLTEEQGTIDLPLRVDLEDRPRQLVCYEYGKAARTRYEVVGQEAARTRIHFFPVTGRTHQLRVHAAHRQGLNIPIAGDDLYGVPQDRLYLHAEEIVFQHPILRQEMKLICPADF